jgi:hypothetical protein
MSSPEELGEAVASLAITNHDNSSLNPNSRNVQNSPKVALAKFTGFPNLPKELRLKIWKCAAFIPRNVDVWIGPWTLEGTDDDSYWEIDDTSNFYFFSTSTAPKILHVCHESRQEGLLYHQLSFGTERGTGAQYFRRDPSIYLNWSTDTVCLMNADHLGGWNSWNWGQYHSDIVADIVRQCCAGKLGSLAFAINNILWMRHYMPNSPDDFTPLLSVAKELRTCIQDLILFVPSDANLEEELLERKATISMRPKSKIKIPISVWDREQLKTFAEATRVLEQQFAQEVEGMDEGNVARPDVRLCEMFLDFEESYAGIK